MLRWAILSIGILGFGAAGWGGERMTPERLWQLGRLEDAALSADGSQVAYAVRHYNLAENSGTSELHVVGWEGSSDRSVAAQLKSISCIQWARVGGAERLYFVAVFADQTPATPQAWSLDVAEGKPLQLTRLDAGIANLKVAPTGTQIAFTMEVKLDRTVQELYTDLPKADARIIDELLYRHWDTWRNYTFSHLHVAPLEAGGTAGPPRDVMAGLRANCPLAPFGGPEHFDWSPDGRELAYTAKIVNNPAESTDSDIYLAAADGSRPTRCITHGMNGYDTDPVYSPDGRYLAFLSMARPSFESDRNRIMVFDRSSGTIRELTAGLDQTAHDERWAPDSASLFFRSEHRGTEQLYRVRVDAGGAEPITRGRFNWTLRAVAPDGQSLLVSRQDMLRPNELFRVTVADGTSRPLSHINDAQYGHLELPHIEERWVRASDGQMIHNWLILPPDFDPARKWPMLTYCQGGPQGQIGQWFSYRWNFHLMAANGYVVLAVNRRGLPGFGQAWNDEISGDWGGQAMQDILAATDEMLAQPFIDARRVAAVGASYGGYTVYWLMGHHEDRFRCMIAHAGVFDLESMYGSTEELFFTNYDLRGPYWKSDAIQAEYNRFSPNRFVGRWKTPLLIIHGEKDFRVPVTQGMEAFTAAQVQGVPSRFLYFPTESHWVSSPQNSVLWQRVFFDWLSRYIGAP